MPANGWRSLRAGRPMQADRPRVVAYQLSLLGEPPKPSHGWRPTFYVWTLSGVPIPPCDDALRQAALMRRDTLSNGPTPTEERHGE